MGILAGHGPQTETLGRIGATVGHGRRREPPKEARRGVNERQPIDVPHRHDSAVKQVTDHTGIVFAHAEGFRWDEALMVLAPILVIAAVLLLANSRANRLGDADEPTEPAEPASSDADGPASR
jgi:hypothetical protein